MSWRAGDLIVFWLCFIAVSEAALFANCNENDSSNCTAIIESCISDSCACSGGHFNVSNVCKSSSIIVTLTTQYGSVVYGSTVILTATITSEVPLNSIKWLKGSTELVIASPKYTQSGVGPGKVTLTIHNVDFTDSGIYQVEVSNLAGTPSTSNQVSLTVTGEKPTVIVPMTISEIGTTVTIHCTASVSQGSPALTAVYWLFNGKNLDISNSNKYSGGIVNNPSLSIKNLASTDAGVYHCGATNLLGSTNSSQSVTLAPPSVSVSQPANPVYNGTRIIFSGSYTSTLLNVKSIKWQRMNGNAFSDINITEDKYNESTDTGSNPTLVIKKVDFIDKAYFRLTVSNGLGITPSEAVYLNVIDGSISVTLATTSNSARYGSDVILIATITSTASVNPIKWQKVSSNGNLENLDITLSKYTQNDVGQGTVALTIKNVTFTDGGSYQVEVSNVAGKTDTSNQVSFSVKVGQFDESCTDQQICDTSKNLQCTTLNRCLCTSAFYHNNQLCYEKSRLAPIIIHLSSTTATLSVFWSPPTTDSELVSTYEVTWKVKGASIWSSTHLDNSKSRYTVPSGLMSGQIYIVNVIPHVNLTNPEQTIVVTSADSEERLTPLAPGPIIMEQSNFAYDNLQIRWTKPSNTFVTGYEVIIDDTKYITSSSELIQFNGKNFTPGKYYNVTIVTVSGITYVKKSVKYTKEIRITPTKPEPPTDVRCPEVPLDVSLEISWKAPNNANGVILQYQITIHLDNPRVINVSSTDLSKNVEGLSPEQSYTFSVRTINDAEESISVSEPSTISCTTKAGEKPTVTVPGTIAETGTTVTIHCTVSVSQGSPALTSVYWLFNGQNLDISDLAKYSGGTGITPSLSINNIGPTDAGEYRCGATNLLGSSTSSQSVTLVAPTFVTVSKQPAGPVNYNSSITFTGSYTSNILSVTIKWQKLKGGNLIDIDITTDKYTGSSVTGTSPKLKINPVQLIDETSYRLEVSNGVGSTSSNLMSLNMIGGNLTVSTGANVIGRFGGSVTIDCTVTGPEANNIQWKRHINNNTEDISIDGQKITGGSVDTKALTINSLNNNDALYQYQCTASNPRGVFKSATTATVTVKYGQFDEDCSNSEPCESTKFFTCTNSKCLCMNAYYHKDQVCYLKSGIASTVISLNSMTNKFSIFWNNPSTHYELVSGYEVKWRIEGSMEDSSGQLSRTVNQYTPSSNLTSGQLYIVNVISHVTLTNPVDSIVIPSSDEEVRLIPLPPGPILNGSSNFAYDNLIIKWTAPAKNTFVTKYRVSIDGATQQTSSHKPEIHFTAKDLTPGMNYTVKIVTVSGTTDNVKESSELIETIMITPTMSSAPTNLNIVEIQSRKFRIQFNRPDDVNGILVAYKIVISEGGNCVQQILVHGVCSICKSTGGCPSPINYTVSDITNSDVSYTATGLDPYSHYVVKVVAINGEGEGHPVNETVRTDEEVPLKPGQITASNVQSSSLTLAWTLPDPSPGNTTYTIYIYEGTDDNGTSFLMKESTKVFGFETKMLLVTGLEEYWPYKFKVNAATVKGNRTSDFSSVFKTKQAVIKDYETTSTSSIIGSVVAVILVVAVVVIGIFLWKRNRRHKELKERANNYADLKLDERTKLDQPYSLLEHGSRTVNSKSVPLNSFYDYVVDLLNNSRQKLTKEYHDLLQDTERSALTVASSKANVSKNRGNIIPYDSNRVRLCSPGASDYINASVLLDKCYILTSYPITKTFGNFWQMVWEQNVSTIVVMTGHSDDRESWYFSDNEGTVRTMERIDVELLAKFKSSESVTMRKIKLSRGKHSKVVNHFHVISLEMTDLPDQILALINTITQNNVKNTGPQVVHGGCTGVDNSGVYIAVDHAVKSVVSGGNEIDVYGTARTVIKERMFSISSLEQYSAIYTCLQKYVQNSPASKNDATGAYEYLP